MGQSSSPWVYDLLRGSVLPLTPRIAGVSRDDQAESSIAPGRSRRAFGTPANGERREHHPVDGYDLRRARWNRIETPSTDNVSPSADRHPPYPVGVIGCGRMGRLHARVYAQMPQVKLVGVYDANAEAAEATAAEYGGRAFDDDRGRCWPRPKAVTIAVPTQFHADVAEACLSRGVACLIEKPLAKDVADARRIVEAAAQAPASPCRSGTSSGSTRPSARWPGWTSSRGSSRSRASAR